MNENATTRESYWLLGTYLTILADHARTDGRYDLIEGRFAAGTQTPPHRHRAYSEHLYVLEGEFTVHMSGQKTMLRPGDDFTIPVGVAHVAAATGGRPGRALVVASPSAFARLIKELGKRDDGSGPPPADSLNMERFLQVSTELGDELLGPPGSLPD